MRRVVVTCWLAVTALGCPPSEQGERRTSAAGPPATATSTAAAATATATAHAGIPLEEIQRTNNPKGDKPYVGPTATLKGTVRVKGDPAPTMSVSIPRGCGAAAATYGKLFRVGQDDTLADVLVAVAGYPAYVPARQPFQSISIAECAYSSRTIALTFGQYLKIENQDNRKSYLPVLVGARLPAKLVATPKGSVKLFAPKPGRYLLTDEIGNTHMKADVFVLKYATFDVTGLDGRYEIKDIPVGKVQVNALLPAARWKTTKQEIELKQGDNSLDLTVEFDASKDAPGDGGAPDAAAEPQP